MSELDEKAVRLAYRKACCNPRIGSRLIVESDIEEIIRAYLAAAPAPKVAVPEASIFEMRLCEQDYVILKPDQLYRFTVDPDCPGCRRTAAHAGVERIASQKKRPCGDGSCVEYRNMNGGCDVCGEPCF